MPLDVHAEDGVGLRLRVIGSVCEFHTAGLASSADLHLSLDDDGSANLEGCLARCRAGRADLTRGDRNLMRAEELLGLVLVQVHA